jgi:hypothetical protein
LNEYEYYPDGNPSYKPVADLWVLRLARLIKQADCHKHLVAVHNLSRNPSFAQRFAKSPGAIDTILLQEWGTIDQADGWLAAGIEDNRHTSLVDWPGSVLLAEYGYERNPALLLMPLHEYCSPEHTRRGAWRGAMSGWGVIHGFENSWGPFALLEEDQPGLSYLLHLRHFFTEIVSFANLQAVENLISQETEYSFGQVPLVLADDAMRTIVVYLPTGLPVQLNYAALSAVGTYTLKFFDPTNGVLGEATVIDLAQPINTPVSPANQDWVLVLEAN